MTSHAAPDASNGTHQSPTRLHTATPSTPSLSAEEITSILSEHVAQEGIAGFWNRLGRQTPPTANSPEGQRIIAAYQAERQKESSHQIGLLLRQQLPQEYRERPGRIVVVGIKGGVAKTTTASLLSINIALSRMCHVVTVNADPSIGANLSRRLFGQKKNIHCTIGNLTRDTEAVNSGATRATRYLQVGERYGESVSLLNTDEDPFVVSNYDRETLDTALSALRLFADFVVVDNGAEVSSKFALAGLETADAVVVVSDNTDDAYDSLPAIIKLIGDHAPRLKERIIVSIVGKVAHRRVTNQEVRDVDPANLRSLAMSAGAVASVIFPYDDSLSAAGPINIDLLSQKTRNVLDTLTIQVLRVLSSGS